MMLLATVAYSQEFATNGRHMDIVELINSSKTMAADDTVSVNTGVLAADCDSIAFIVVVRGDSTTYGTTRDSLMYYLKQQWISPDDDVNVAAWASYDSVSYKAYTGAGNMIHIAATATTSEKPFRRLYFKVANHAEGAQKVYYKVWAIKRWRND